MFKKWLIFGFCSFRSWSCGKTVDYNNHRNKEGSGSGRGGGGSWECNVSFQHFTIEEDWVRSLRFLKETKDWLERKMEINKERESGNSQTKGRTRRIKKENEEKEWIFQTTSNLPVGTRNKRRESETREGKKGVDTEEGGRPEHFCLSLPTIEALIWHTRCYTRFLSLSLLLRFLTLLSLFCRSSSSFAARTVHWLRGKSTIILPADVQSHYQQMARLCTHSCEKWGKREKKKSRMQGGWGGFYMGSRKISTGRAFCLPLIVTTTLFWKQGCGWKTDEGHDK